MAEIKTTYLPGDKVFVLIESCISEVTVCEVSVIGSAAKMHVQYKVQIIDEEGDFDYRHAYLSKEDQPSAYAPESYLYPTPEAAAAAVLEYWTAIADEKKAIMKQMEEAAIHEAALDLLDLPY